MGRHAFTDTVLRVSVQEIRKALGDSAVAPQYLETVGRQGYRFLVGSEPEGLPALTDGPLVGRQSEVEALEEWYQRATQGTRQLVFISGEAGVGKTTVVELFLTRLAARGEVWTGRGQCVEHSGEGEPYLPFVEALERLGRGPEQDEVRAVLRRYAPLWLAQLPSLVSETELERLQSRLYGATPARMLRELAEALEVLTANRALVLLLEDLQWSDPSTVEGLAYLAQRREPARLLVLGTYRPVEMMLRGHPLRGMAQELCGRGQGVELRLEFLTAADVTAYVIGRLGGPVAPSLAAFIYARTDGNALFMVNIVEHLVQQGVLVRQAGQWTLREEAEAQVESLPEGLRGLLLRRIEALPPEARRVLEAASVVGEAFAVAAVAAGCQEAVEAVEAVCAGLAAQRHFIDDAGWTVWPDTTSGGQYRFQHALYPQVLYESLGTARRVPLHQRIGARLEAGYGAQAGEIAAQLAVHFERAGEIQRAVQYWQQTGENASRRYAYPEALAALRKGLALLATLPENAERLHHELRLLLILGEILITMKGMAAPEVGEVYTRVHTLCHQVGELPQLLKALRGLCWFHVTQAQFHTASELALQIVHMAQCQSHAGFAQEGQAAMGFVALLRGNLVAARAHLETLFRADTSSTAALSIQGRGYYYHRRVSHLGWMMQVLWKLGYADQARQQSAKALTLARQGGDSASLAYAQLHAILLSQFRQDAAATHTGAEALIAFASAQGLVHRAAQGRILLGWALARQGDATAGLAHVQQGLEANQGTGLKLYRPYFLALLAETSAQAGQPEAGLIALSEALAVVAATAEQWWEAELYRLQGELLLQAEGGGQQAVLHAAERFHQALALARRQQARALELRAALSLGRLWQQQGKRSAARQLLTECYSWFTEGFDTADSQAARALLEELLE